MQHGGYNDSDLFIYVLLLVYLTISVAQTRKLRRAEWLLNKKLEMMRKGEVRE